MTTQTALEAGRKKPIDLDDELRFFRSWVQTPLITGAVAPSSRHLAQMMAGYVDPAAPGPVIEVGPGTGRVTEALVARGIDPARLVLVEFNPTFCELMRTRYPAATIVNVDAYNARPAIEQLGIEPAAAVISGLPLFTKPLAMRVQLLSDMLALAAPGAPFIQFTYATIPPIPRNQEGFSAEPSPRVWMNIPPARVWVYRRLAP